MLGLNVHGAHLPTVLSRRQIRSRAYVGMVKAESGGPRSKRDPPFASWGNEGSAFLGGPVHINRYLLTMPVELLRSVRVIIYVCRDRLAFLEAKQRARELAVVGDCRDDSLWRQLNGRGVDS